MARAGSRAKLATHCAPQSARSSPSRRASPKPWRSSLSCLRAKPTRAAPDARKRCAEPSRRRRCCAGIRCAPCASRVSGDSSAVHVFCVATCNCMRASPKTRYRRLEGAHVCVSRSLLIGVLALAACARAVQAPPPQPLERPSSGVQVQRAERAAGRAWLDSPATVLAAPGTSASVSVPLSARVLRVRVRRGQRVEAGEALIDLVMPELMRAAGALSGASIRLEAYEKRRQSVAALLERGLARASELAELEVQIADARADRESARATLRAAGVRDAEAPALLGGAGSSALRAPIAGVVVLLSAQPGEVREPGSGPLVELADQADVQIEARLAHLPPRARALQLSRRGAAGAARTGGSFAAGQRPRWDLACLVSCRPGRDRASSGQHRRDARRPARGCGGDSTPGAR